MQQVQLNTSIKSSNPITQEDLDQLSEKVLGTGHKKLTDWKQEPTAQNLLDDYQQAASFHSNHISRVAKWLEILNAKTDKNRLKKGRSGIVPKMVRRLAEWRYSSLASSILNEKNLFQVSATSPDHLNASIQNGLVLNYQFNNLINKVKFVNDLTRAMVNEGTAIVRIGWEVEQQKKEFEVPVYEYVQADMMQAQMIMGAMQQISQEQEQTGVESSDETQVFQSFDSDFQESIKASSQYGMPVVAVNTGQTQTISEIVDTKNKPSVKVINTQDLIIDPSCDGDFSKARFAIYKYQTDLSTLKAFNQKFPDTYKNLEYLERRDGVIEEGGITPANMPTDVYNAILEDYADGKQFTFNDKPRQKLQVLEYWGYWDIDGTGIVQSFTATICNGFIIKMERNPFPDGGLPFVIIPYMPIKNSVYGEPDAELVEDNQKILTALVRSVIDINARSANGQTATPKGYLDPTNYKKFREGEDYEYNPNGSHPAEAIYMHTANEVSQTAMMLMQQQYSEAEAATGIKSFQGGLDGNAYGQVVAGMSQAISAMNQREGDIIFRIAKGLEEIGAKILKMNTEWLNEEEVFAITQTDFVKIRKEDLQGNFFLQVRIKSNSEAEGKAQQMSFLFQTMGPNADWGMQKLMLLELGQLYNLDTFVSALQKYEPQPDPIQQELAQLEVELAKAKLQKEQEEAAYYRARSNYIDAQIGNTQADTDLKNLDFMEQQEGVKHARQKEIVEAQARAQNEGKIATETLKGRNALAKAKMDNDTKKEVADSKADSKDKPKKSGSKVSPQRNFKPLPNPELGALPSGLFKADGLGNYIKGDGHTVNNEI